MNFKKGDIAIVNTGKDKGKKAKVLRVISESNKVLLEGLNTYKKHEKPRQQGKKGQTVERSTPINISNVSLYCEKCKKGVRVSKEVDKKGKKQRVCAKCKNNLG